MAATLTTSVMDRPVATLEMDLCMPSHKLDHKVLHEIHGGLAFFEDDVSTEAPDDTDSRAALRAFTPFEAEHGR